MSAPHKPDFVEAILEAHPVTELRRCGNRISEPVDPPPGPPSPPIWCNRPADGHAPEACTTYDGLRLAGWVRGGLTIDVRPPVVSYRCETCRTVQDHRSSAPCETLAALRHCPKWRVRHVESGATVPCRDQAEAEAHVRGSVSGPWIAELVYSPEGSNS